MAGAALVTSLALAACGPVDDGALPALPRGGVAGSGERGAARLPASAAEAAYPGPTPEYRVDGTLPDLDGTATAYRLDDEVGRPRVEKLARALGLRGPVENKGEGGWTAADGNRRLAVEPVAGLPWHFGEEAVGEPECVAPESEAAVRDSAPVTCVRADSPVSSRPPPSRPPDLPSKPDAERRARDFFRDAGFEGSGVRVDDEPAAGWRAVLAAGVEGVEVVGLEQSVTIGSTGAIRWASGFLAAPEKLGDYRLAGTRAGVSRLREGVGAGPRPMPAVGAEPGSPPPPLVQTPPPPLVQTIVEAELVLMMVHAPCPGLPAHLVPAYRFRLAEEGDALVVPAVEDRHLESPPAEDAAARACRGGEDGTEPAVKPEEAPRPAAP